MKPLWREIIRQYRHPGLSHEIIQTAGIAAKERIIGDPLRLSNSGKCARQLAYQKVHHAAVRYSLESPFPPETMNPRALLTFHLGDMVEDSVKAWIKRAGSKFMPLSPPKDRVSIHVAEKEISGHPDGLYQEQDGSLSLVSIKSINTLGFDRVEREGPPYEAVCQDTAYMAGLGIYKTRFLYYNKNTSHIADDWVVEFSPELYTEITNRWARVIGANVENLPEREYQPEAETEWVRGLKGYKAGRPDPGPSGFILDTDGKRVTEVKQNGYWRETGRKILQYPCSYCVFKQACYGEKLKPVEIEGSTPTWVVEAA